MRVTLRREKRRRSMHVREGYPLPLPHDVQVEYVDKLLHPASMAGQWELTMVATRDCYLASGLRFSPAPLCHSVIIGQLDEALDTSRRAGPLHLLIDLHGLVLPPVELLDRLRHWQRRTPSSARLTLLSSVADPLALRFIEQSCLCRVIDKHLPLRASRQAMLSPRPADPPTLFSSGEWELLRALAQGKSLRQIAHQQQHSYHRIVYRQGKILSRLQLTHRSLLLRLLQRIGHDIRTNYSG